MNLVEVKAEIERLARELSTQDNLSTSDPIFVVERHVRDVGMDPDYSETVCWIDAANEDEVYPDQDPERHATIEAAYRGEVPWPEETEEDDWTRTGFRWRWEFVQPFLTRAAAEQFRALQAHNLGETRVYVESGYRNAEWKLLRELIAELSRKGAT